MNIGFEFKWPVVSQYAVADCVVRQYISFLKQKCVAHLGTKEAKRCGVVDHDSRNLFLGIRIRGVDVEEPKNKTQTAVLKFKTELK